MQPDPDHQPAPTGVGSAMQPDDLVLGEETVSAAAVLTADPAEIEASMVPPKQAPLWRRLGVQFWLCALWIVVVGIAGVASGVLPLKDPLESDFTALAEGPSWQYWMGTDALGRDLFSRVVHGTRVSITVGLFAVAIGLLLGGMLGLVAGYYRRRTEATIMTLADAMLAFPSLVLLLTLTTFLGLAQREFVLAAKATGSRDFRIITREVLPNVAMPLMAFSLVVVAVAIVAEGSLSFLGLSVPPTQPTWGNIIAGGRQNLQDAPHIVFFPSLVMFVTVLAFNLAGDRLREVLEVKEGAL